MILFLVGSVALTGSEFSESQAVVALTNIACSGIEMNLLNCSYRTQARTECGTREDAGVVCQCMSLIEF